MEESHTPTKDDLVARAKLAEQAERYDDMVEIMKKLAEMDDVLVAEERNLLSVAYKNVVGTRRSSWRVMSSIEQKEDSEKRKKMAQDYLLTISKEIEDICKQVVKLIDDHLLKDDPEDFESCTFYMKMKGDYFRYVAEVKSGETKKTYAGHASDAYKAAYELCQTKMDPPHPIRLGLALNYSVFYFEIMEEHSKACEIAKNAFDDAIKEMDALEQDKFKDSSLIMQLLRDNLTLWTAADDDDDNVGQQQECAAEPAKNDDA